MHLAPEEMRKRCTRDLRAAYHCKARDRQRGHKFRDSSRLSPLHVLALVTCDLSGLISTCGVDKLNLKQSGFYDFQPAGIDPARGRECNQWFT
jgi:hypothetical protein